MEATCSSATLTTIYLSTQCHITKDSWFSHLLCHTQKQCLAALFKLPLLLVKWKGNVQKIYLCVNYRCYQKSWLFLEGNVMLLAEYAMCWTTAISWFNSLQWERIFPFYEASILAQGPTCPSIWLQWFSKGNASNVWSWLLTFYSAMVRNEWNSNSTPIYCAFMVCARTTIPLP